MSGYKPSFTVNSKHRLHKSTTSSSSFTYRLDIGDAGEYDSVTINYCTIPKFYYTLNQGVLGNDDTYDNQFELSEDNGSTWTTITVPVGNYNIQNFQIVIIPLLNAASVVLGNTFTYSISYPDPSTETDTGKFTYSVTGNAGVQPQFKMNDNRIRKIMGLGCYDANGAEMPCIFTGDSLISDEIVDMHWTRHIVIKSNIALNAGNNSQDSAILAVIPVGTVDDREMIQFASPGLDLDSGQLSNSSGNIFEFSIHDDQDRLLDLNGGEWFMQIQLFKQNRYFDIAVKKMQIDTINEIAK